MEKKKVLLIKMGALGDIVHSTVIPQAIKESYPDCEIHYLTTQFHTSILEQSPYVDKIIVYKNKLFETVKELFKNRYDVIFGLNYTLKIALLSYLLLPQRVVFRGYKGVSWVENYFNTAKVVFKNIKLPERLHLLQDEELSKNFEEELKKFPKPHILFCPGRVSNNARQGRIWNIDKWNELSKEILKRYGGTIFVIGSTNEKKYHEVLEKEHVYIYTGKHGLKQTMAFISNADFMISADSGPVHVASAYNVKTISILGSTSPDKIKPYGENGYYVGPKTECKYCWKKKCDKLSKNNIYTPCIESIDVEDILLTIDKNNLLQKNE